MMLPRWQLKAAAQGVISLLPWATAINRLLQRTVTRSLDVDNDWLLGKWRRCQQHLRHRRQRLGIAADGPFRALELGTGWYPVVPVGLALCGANRVWTVDLNDHLSAARVAHVLRFYRQLAAAGELDGWATPAALTRLERLTRSAPDGVLHELGVVQLLADARGPLLPAGSVDLFSSSNTLEHISGAVLLDILRELRRIARPGALMSHFIDMGDHYANVDPSISVFNFLRYSERRWRLFNNRLHYVNRLRLSDFRRLFHAAGWRVVGERHTRGDADELARVPLADEFSRYTRDDLLTHESWLVAVPADDEDQVSPR